MVVLSRKTNFKVDHTPVDGYTSKSLLAAQLESQDLWWWCFLKTVSLRSPGCPGTHRDLPTYASQVLGLEANATMSNFGLTGFKK